MLKGVIFDFDGTLFDSMFIWDTAGEAYLRSLGKEPASDLQRVLKPMSLLQSAEYLQAHYQLSLSVEEICAGINQMVEDFYFHTVQPKPGVIELLEELHCRNIKMCIATATDRYQVEAALARCGMKQYFSNIFTCTEVGSGKDESIIFRTAMEHLGTERCNTVVFEDTYHAARTAKADGFMVAAIYDAHENKQQDMQHLSDAYLPNFLDAAAFWEFASNLGKEQST